MIKISNEFKTGIVVIAAVAVASVFWLKTSKQGNKPYRIKTQFNFAEGIKPDSIVKLSGVDVGRVEKITFIYEPGTKVEMVLLIDTTAKVREDSIAYVAISGMVGDTYVGITSGSADKAFLAPGSMIPSEDPVEMRKLMKKAETIAENLDKTLIEFKDLAANLNGVVSGNKSKIDNITSNLESTSANFKDFSEDIKQHPWKLLMKGK